MEVIGPAAPLSHHGRIVCRPSPVHSPVCPNGSDCNEGIGMAIDRQREQVIPIREVPRYVPSRSSGKRVALSTVWRWAMRQDDPLETFATPGGRFTSVEAVNRFIDRISKAKGITDGAAVIATPSANTHRPSHNQQPDAAVEAGQRLQRLIGSSRQSAR